jgi:hypothetical protein
VKKSLAVAKAINPKTGENDLIGAIQELVTFLNKEGDVEKGRHYHQLTGSMQARMKRFGIPVAYLADFQLLIQEMGLVRRVGAGPTLAWKVVDLTSMSELVCEQLVSRSLAAVLQRHNDHEELRCLRKALEKKAGTPDDSAPASDSKQVDDMKIVEQLAEAVATAEGLAAGVVVLNDRVSELEKLLAAKPAVNPKDVASALMERLSKIKK